MSLTRARTFLWVVIVLTVCQYTEANTYIIKDDTGDVQHIIYDTATKIAGGEYARLGQFPYMALVHRFAGPAAVETCGGTIISKRWVLTAGHCAIQFPQKFLIVFGIVDKSNIRYDTPEGPAGISMMTNEVIIHPNYAQAYNDIALLRTPRNIPFSHIIQPIRLPNPDYVSFPDQIAFVIGWGHESVHSQGLRHLKYTRLPIIENRSCRQYWRISNAHICTAGGTGTSACQGDSGGPLVVREDGKDLQVGIVSFGNAQCPRDAPGVFIRVASFRNWIWEIANA